MQGQQQAAWSRWAALALAAVATWQSVSACSSSAEAKKQAEQAAFYRGRWSQVCYLLERCSDSDCRSDCGTEAWCR
jgi:hypothetical protein